MRWRRATPDEFERGSGKGVAKDVHFGDSFARLPVDTVLLSCYQLHERDFRTRYLRVWENGTPPARGRSTRLCTREEHYDGLPNLFAVTSAQPLTD